MNENQLKMEAGTGRRARVLLAHQCFISYIERYCNIFLAILIFVVGKWKQLIFPVNQWILGPFFVHFIDFILLLLIGTIEIWAFMRKDTYISRVLTIFFYKFSIWKFSLEKCRYLHIYKCTESHSDIGHETSLWFLRECEYNANALTSWKGMQITNAKPLAVPYWIFTRCCEINRHLSSTF